MSQSSSKSTMKDSTPEEVTNAFRLKIVGEIMKMPDDTFKDFYCNYYEKFLWDGLKTRYQENAIKCD